MKYLTKEWYLAAQHTDIYRHLAPSERAVEFSEEYFQELFRASEEDYLSFQRSVCNADRESLAAKFTDVPPSHIDGTPLTEEEKSIASAFQSAFAEAIRTAPRPVFNPEKEKLEHHNRFTQQLDVLKFKYPSEILEKVADPRVLALEHASPDIWDMIEKYCLQNRSLVNSASEAERIEHQRNWTGREPAFFQNFDFHDFSVDSFRRDTGDAVMSFGNNVTCHFHNATVLKCDSSLKNAIWLYDEIYPIGSGYEIHALLLSNPELHLCIDSYSDLIIQCSDVTICNSF